MAVAGEFEAIASRQTAIDLIIRVTFSGAECRFRVQRLVGSGGSYRAVGSGMGEHLVSGGHGPSALHPPYGEGVAQPFVGQVVTTGQLGIHFIALENLVEKVDVSRSQFEDLNLAQFVRRQRGDDLPQRGESVV